MIIYFTLSTWIIGLTFRSYSLIKNKITDFLLSPLSYTLRRYARSWQPLCITTLYISGYDIHYTPLPTRTLLNPHCSLTSCIRGSTANSRVVRPHVFRIKRDFVTNMLLSLKDTRTRHEHRCSTILGDNYNKLWSSIQLTVMKKSEYV